MAPHPADTVVLLSCGYDSLAAWYVLRYELGAPPRALFFDTGTAENIHERMRYKRLQSAMNAKYSCKLFLDPVSVFGLLSLTGGATVPGRNMVFSAIAAAKGATRIVLAAASDWALDKRLAFTLPMSWALTAAMGYRVSVDRPFYRLNKSALLKRCTRIVGSWDWLADAYSCYLGSARPCALCHACARAMVAFSTAGVPLAHWPWESRRITELGYMKFEHWTRSLFPDLTSRRARPRGIGEVISVPRRALEISVAYERWPR